MNGAQLIVKALEREGVDVVFGYPGGAIMPLYDALLDARFKHVLTRHEQGAAMAADGYARVTGRPGVCLATSGPGATNLVTGIANAFLDSIPMVIITGQVPSAMMGTDAFQEVDVLGITMPVVKHSFMPKKAAELGAAIREAFNIARTGRPGPVLVDVPKDIMTEEVSHRLVPDLPPKEEATLDAIEVQQARSMLRDSRKPLIYAGGGIGLANAVDAFRSFVETTRIPVVSTLKGLGSLPCDHELNLGMLGMHGLKAANLAVQNCDLLIVVGARLDDRATGKLAEFAPKARVIHIDIDPAEVDKLRQAHVGLVGELEPALEALALTTSIPHWRKQCLDNKARFTWDYNYPGEGIYAPRLLRNLSKAAGKAVTISCDVGQHQMWVAQHYGFNQPRQHLTSGGLGTMGFGLPAGIGAQFASPDDTVIVVSGDGSIMMNIQELATLSRYQLPVKILLFDNQTLGLVRQWQELFFNKRFSSVDLSDNPDFCKVAESFGIPAMRFEQGAQENEIVDALLNTQGPLFVHALIDPQENVWPLVPPGKSNAQMMEGAQA